MTSEIFSTRPSTATLLNLLCHIIHFSLLLSEVTQFKMDVCHLPLVILTFDNHKCSSRDCKEFGVPHTNISSFVALVELLQCEGRTNVYHKKQDKVKLAMCSVRTVMASELAQLT